MNKAYIHFIIFHRLAILCIITYLSGCAALSNALNITHTERFTLKGMMFIVNTDKSFNHWYQIFNSPSTLDEGINVTSTGNGFFTIYDKSDNTISLIVKEPYFPELCIDAERSQESGPIHELMKSNGLKITRIYQDYIETCKKGMQSTFPVTSGKGKLLDTPLALLIFEIEYIKESQYRYILSGSRCRDGTLSSSYGKGTCSWHGGVSNLHYQKVYLPDDAKKPIDILQ